MKAEQIAYKYVHGYHDALTDNQEKKDMAEDIIEFAKEYHQEQLKKVLNDIIGTSGTDEIHEYCYELRDKT